MLPRRPTPANILVRARCSAMLITHPTNLRYLTGLQVSQGVLLIRRKQSALYLDSRYIEMAQKTLVSPYAVYPYEQLTNDLKKVRVIGFESQVVTSLRESLMKRKFKNTKFVQRVDIIEYFRRAKQHDELVQIRRACAITRRVLKRVPKLLRMGISERKLAWLIERTSREWGAEAMAFDTIVAFGEHSSRPHHHPTDRKLRKGDIVQIDMGVRVGGYCSDMSRVYCTTKKTAEQQHVFRVLNQVVRECKQRCTVGTTNRSLDAYARAVLKRHGFGKEFCHSLGHGVGLDIHEGLSLSERAPIERLKLNEVVTIEPGLYFPGMFGMRIEDTVLIGQGKCRTL